MQALTTPIAVRCVNCVAPGTDYPGTIVPGIGVGVAVIGVIARADFALTAGLLPDMGDTLVLEASAVIARVELGLQNTGDRAAGETTVEVLVLGGLSGLHWTDRGGGPQFTGLLCNTRASPAPQGGEAPAQWPTSKIPRVPRGAPEHLWLMFTAASAPGEILLRIKARSDDLAKENDPVVHEFCNPRTAGNIEPDPACPEKRRIPVAAGIAALRRPDLPERIRSGGAR